MNLQTFVSASEFLETARAVLEANEAANNLMLGLALTIQRYPERYEIQPFFGVVLEPQRVQVAALMTPPTTWWCSVSPGQTPRQPSTCWQITCAERVGPSPA